MCMRKCVICYTGIHVSIDGLKYYVELDYAIEYSLDKLLCTWSAWRSSGTRRGESWKMINDSTSPSLTPFSLSDPFNPSMEFFIY